MRGPFMPGGTSGPLRSARRQRDSFRKSRLLPVPSNIAIETSYAWIKGRFPERIVEESLLSPVSFLKEKRPLLQGLFLCPSGNSRARFSQTRALAKIGARYSRYSGACPLTAFCMTTIRPSPLSFFAVCWMRTN